MTSITISPTNPTVSAQERPLSNNGPRQNLNNFMRPRFFCGQFLTDQDLMALLEWSQGRFGLSRLRHGWGVACGLELRIDPKQHGHVIVSPGYAVSPQGEDIILTQDISFDLSAACRVERNPCCPDHISDCSEGERNDDDFRPVHIFIRFHEELRHPQTALGSGTCSEAANCEYSRVKERFSLHWQHDVKGTDPLTAAAAKWQQGYEKSMDVLTAFQNAFDEVNANNITAVQNWLCSFIKKYPLFQLGYIQHYLCQMSEEEFDERVVHQALFLMALDYRNAYLTSSCLAQESKDILLGRVWVKTNENDAPPVIYLIDAQPPYRREIQLDQWPAPLGMVNGAQAIWHRAADARAILMDLGLQLESEQTIDTVENLDQIRQILNHRLFFYPGEVVTPIFLNERGLGRRLISFYGNSESFAEESLSPSTANLWNIKREEAAENEPNAGMESSVKHDDLTKIKGIGKIRENELNQLGIFTYVALANADAAELADNLSAPISINQVSTWQELAGEIINSNIDT